MKIVHIADLHIGKRLNEFSLIGDQEYILGEILAAVEKENIDCVVIAGDVYDKSMPSCDAVNVFDDFLTKLSEKNITTFIIAGNHDSAERLGFGSRIFEKSGIHISKSYNPDLKAITLSDEFGAINFYLLPYITPNVIKSKFENKEIMSFTDAVAAAIDNFAPNYDERNILVSHQFITGASKFEDEAISVGGSDNVDCSVMQQFDYVALGHLHGAQAVGGREHMRYSGSPLKYSFSECGDDKSITIIDLKQKGDMTVSHVPLVPMRDMCKIKGTYDEIMSKSFYENKSTENYMHITLTDENDVLDAVAKLRSVYPFIMQLGYDNTRTRSYHNVGENFTVPQASPLENFEKLYNLQHGESPNESEVEIISQLVQEIWGEK